MSWKITAGAQNYKMDYYHHMRMSPDRITRKMIRVYLTWEKSWLTKASTANVATGSNG